MNTVVFCVAAVALGREAGAVLKAGVVLEVVPGVAAVILDRVVVVVVLPLASVLVAELVAELVQVI
jgi:hypothetical protein